MRSIYYSSLFFIFILTAFSTVQSQNLITNGNFESGDGIGFSSAYTATIGPSVQKNYAIVTNPSLINSSFSNTCIDHTTGTGNMMAVDGSGSAADIVWQQLPVGGIAVIPGRTYTFSYWIQSISNLDSVNNLANIAVQINGVTLTPTSGSTVCPLALCAWSQVTYTWTATGNTAQINLYDTQTSSIGNDFALDDLSLTLNPLPLSLTYSIINPICPDGSNGSIVVYASGGTPPYLYSLNGGSFSSNNVFTGLGPSTANYVSVMDSTKPTALDTSSDPALDIVAPTSSLRVRNGTTINSGSSTSLYATGASSYTWTASPADPSLTTPHSATPTVSPTTTTVYTVTSPISSSMNLISNPGFENGNTGFYSDYTNFTSSTFPRTYGITTNSSLYNGSFASLPAHGGSGNMLVVDGSNINGGHDKVWNQIIPVTANTNYSFSYWIQTVSTPNPAIIETKVNGVAITGSATTSTDTSSASAGGWSQVTYSWNSGANTLANITLYDLDTANVGNAFALDDLSFSTNSSCSVSKTVTITVVSVLPVKLVSFDSKWNDSYHHSSLISWITASEINMSNYVVERSVDGIDFVDIGTINIVAENSKDNYSFTDNNISNNSNVFYYRIRMVDQNGLFTYSKVAAIKKTDDFSNILIFPNPTHGIVTLQGTKPMTHFTVFDATGRKLFQANAEINTNRQVNLGNLPSGIYLYSILFSDNSTENGKLMINK